MIGGRLMHEFVPLIPAEIKPATLYVCIPYATAVHLCPDCARKVVTPFAPGSWNLIFDGETASIWPSIRNGAHGCRSHYFIERDRFVRARDTLASRIGSGRTPQTASVNGIFRRARSWFERLTSRGSRRSRS